MNIKKTQYICKYTTPKEFSNILIRSDGEYLTGLWFDDSNDDLKYQRLIEASKFCEPKDLEIFKETSRWLDDYFSGNKPKDTPNFRLNGLTAIREEVISEMLKIPYGKTKSYGEIAAAIAKKRGIEKMSAQAVGGAVGWNPISIIIPCHRVLGSNGSLTGYGGGIENKRALLELESRGKNNI